MKNMILGLGTIFIEIGTIIQLLVLLGLSIGAGIYTCSVSSSEVLGWFAGIIALIILFIIFVLGNYLFFMLISIHDSFASMAKSLDFIANNGILAQTKISQSQNQNNQKCPNCGKVYNIGDKFCEECGTKLD